MTEYMDEAGGVVKSFEDNGFAVLEDVFDVTEIDSARESSMHHFNELIDIISNSSDEFGIGVKHGYQEIVQRHQGRYEMAYKMRSEQFVTFADCPRLVEIVRRLLGTQELNIANQSCVVSLSNTVDQKWHSDGPHLSLSEYQPCHCLNVFIPLVDITLENGPTEFRVGSHRYTNNLAKGMLLAFARKKNKPNEAPLLKRGSVLLVKSYFVRVFCLSSFVVYRSLIIVSFIEDVQILQVSLVLFWLLHSRNHGLRYTGRFTVSLCWFSMQTFLRIF